MVKCPECGEILTETDKTCPSCGKSLSNKKQSSNKLIAVIAIIFVIAIVGVLASGMFSSDNSSSDANQNSKNVDPIKEDTSSDSSGASEYWASAKAEKFHLPTCEWAEKISEDNKIIYQSREEAIEDGKIPCGACNP